MAVDESPQGRRRLRLPFTTGEPTKERHSHKVRIWNIAGEHENRDCDAACGSCRRSRGRESGQSLVAPDRLAVTPATFPTDTSGVRSRRQAEHVTDAVRLAPRHQLLVGKARVGAQHDAHLAPLAANPRNDARHFLDRAGAVETALRNCWKRGEEPQRPRPPASGPGRPCGGAAALRARAGDQPEGARPRASLYGDSPPQLRRPAARPLFERALAIYDKALGPEHPDTATGLNNLAVLLQVQGDLAAARPLYERALAIRENALGPEHPDTAIVRKNLANLFPHGTGWEADE